MASELLCVLCFAVTITEAYFTAAEYKGTECKYTEVYGSNLSVTIGGGEQKFSFVRSAKVRPALPLRLSGRKVGF